MLGGRTIGDGRGPRPEHSNERTSARRGRDVRCGGHHRRRTRRMSITMRRAGRGGSDAGDARRPPRHMPNAWRPGAARRDAGAGTPADRRRRRADHAADARRPPAARVTGNICAPDARAATAPPARSASDDRCRRPRAGIPRSHRDGGSRAPDHRPEALRSRHDRASEPDGDVAVLRCRGVDEAAPGAWRGPLPGGARGPSAARACGDRGGGRQRDRLAGRFVLRCLCARGGRGAGRGAHAACPCRSRLAR